MSAMLASSAKEPPSLKAMKGLMGVKVSREWLLLQPENGSFATSPNSQMAPASLTHMEYDHSILKYGTSSYGIKHNTEMNSWGNHALWDACLKA